jgi:hypothetical protein
MAGNFQTFKLENEFAIASCDDKFPTAFCSWSNRTRRLSAVGTHFGYVFQGATTLETNSGTFALRENMYFCVPGEFQLSGGAGVIMTRHGFQGIFSLGGPIEENGRLRYIDGCRDSLLIPPLIKGDPCLNALYFPENIVQTQHTHPSVRAGVVACGRGECLTPDGVFPLSAGTAFVISPEALHSFNTCTDPMVVIAYHPDSDFGATHDDHPMVNLTMVNGVSAAKIDEIRTTGD